MGSCSGVHLRESEGQTHPIRSHHPAVIAQVVVERAITVSAEITHILSDIRRVSEGCDVGCAGDLIPEAFAPEDRMLL